MTRIEYRAARRLLRDNGLCALRWMPVATAVQMFELHNNARRTDLLTLRVAIAMYRKRDGLACNPRQST